MAGFHHRTLPDDSALLAGHTPPDELGFRSERLQIWYNNSEEAWRDPALHWHEESDECFIVLRGSLVVEVQPTVQRSVHPPVEAGERHVIGPGEFCCFPRGMLHGVIEVHPPIETFMIRAPSVADKQYPTDDA